MLEVCGVVRAKPFGGGEVAKAANGPLLAVLSGHLHIDFAHHICDGCGRGAVQSRVPTSSLCCKANMFLAKTGFGRAESEPSKLWLLPNTT